ncbi:hypothetical protein GOBAR_AA40221 [Gossypium barbadense]|uniref:Uncharacterized protein n=1 Tax=Gossypium barbadense TaxID=3634 RepID=A0A2P5VNR9_GOSBA|nr:hypothetical protein GOBAR_AA40221 [Gossypium barbadense]
MGHCQDSLVFYLIEHLGWGAIKFMVGSEMVVWGSGSLVLASPIIADGSLSVREHCSLASYFSGLTDYNVHVHVHLPLNWSLAADSLEIF